MTAKINQGPNHAPIGAAAAAHLHRIARHLARVLRLVGKVEGLGELRVEDAARGEVIPQEDTRLAKRVVPGQAIVVVQPEPERA